MSNEQGKKAVPGIPLNALDAITDTNVREVLRALVAAHHVRNGNSGTGDERFITNKDLVNATKQTTKITMSTPATSNLAAYAEGVGDGTSYGPNSFSSNSVGTLTITLEMAGNVAVQIVWQSAVNSGDHCNSRMALFSDGISILDTSHSCQEGFTEPHYATGVTTLTAGTHTFTIKFGNDRNAGSYTLGRWSITALPVA